jgi:hypothetical protein
METSDNTAFFLEIEFQGQQNPGCQLMLPKVLTELREMKKVISNITDLKTPKGIEFVPAFVTTQKLN